MNIHGFGNRRDKILLNVMMAIAILSIAAFGYALLFQPRGDGAFAAVARIAENEAAVGSGETAGDFGAPAYGAGDRRGIWVTGSATIAVEPDIAILNVGVEARGATVSAANAEAAAAMEAALGALRASGVADKDIQTRNFSVYPRYEYRDITQRDGGKISRRVLAGYEVSNDVAAKIRDIDSVGETIDAVIVAAGDGARISGVVFGVEDLDALRPELRRMAVADAVAKAEALADLSGVKLGRLLYMSEGAARASGGGYESGFGAFALEAASAPPPISAGEREARFSVSAGFGIR